MTLEAVFFGKVLLVAGLARLSNDCWDVVFVHCDDLEQVNLNPWLDIEFRPATRECWMKEARNNFTSVVSLRSGLADQITNS